MITSVFKKSTPFNFSLVVILMLVFFSIQAFQNAAWLEEPFLIVQKVISVLLLLGSVIVCVYVAKKNDVSKDNAFVLLFYFLLLLFFPKAFDNFYLIAANFFILLSFRRLLSLKALKNSKEKIFDASFWVFVASLFHFWSILFLLVVFIAILFHVAKDYRHWLLPFVAFFAVAILYAVVVMVFEIDATSYFLENSAIQLKLNYFTRSTQNWVFSVFTTVALFFLVAMFFSYSKKPLSTHTSYKLVIVTFVVAIVVFLLSPFKTNELLLFSLAPLSIMACAHIEMKQTDINKNIVLGVLVLFSLLLFFVQL